MRNAPPRHTDPVTEFEFEEKTGYNLQVKKRRLNDYARIDKDVRVIYYAKVDSKTHIFAYLQTTIRSKWTGISSTNVK